jgi:PAS domain S-box-containing protein
MATGQERIGILGRGDFLYRLVVEEIVDFAIIVMDIEGRILTWNPGAARIFDFTPEEAIGQPCSIIFTPEDVRDGEHLKELETAKAHGRAMDERWHIRKSGARFFSSGVTTSLKDERGVLIGFSKVARDITKRQQLEDDLKESTERISNDMAERRLIEDELIESRNRLHLALESADVGTWDYDVRLGELKLDRRCRRIIELPDNAPIKLETIINRIAIEDRQKLQGNVIYALKPESGGAINVEFRIKTDNDRQCWVSARGKALFNKNGIAIRVIGTALDITVRKQIDQERERLLAREQSALKEAQEANRTKDEFLATLSHELRTPLTSILGWARMLRTGTLDRETTSRAVETIERNARVQTQIIEDILDVSRIITGKLSLNFEPIKLASVLESAISSIQPAADAKGISISKDLGPEGVIISGDSHRLHQIFWNLLSNAIKFTGAGGHVDIKLECLESHARIRVKDTGKGIKPDFLPFVFDRFRQADSTTTRSHGGLGLGLAIVRHLLEIHGGVVKAESEGEGKGATFIVQLPLISDCKHALEFVPIQSGGLAKAGVPGLGGLKVLVVDDEPDTLDFLKQVFENCDARTHAADSAKEAYQLLLNERPDVIVSDIGMPGEDGFTLIRRIRQLSTEEGGKTPAIALTAFASAEDRARVLLAGFQVHLAKPVDPVELAALVASLAGRTGTV